MPYYEQAFIHNPQEIFLRYNMARKLTIEEAEKLHAQKPSMRATFLGLLMGIVLALIAQFLLKPIEVREEHAGNFTVYLGNRPIGEHPIVNFFVIVLGLFGLACFFFWIIQMQVFGFLGRTYQQVQHGMVGEDLEYFIGELDKSLAKVERYGYELKKYPSEPGTFARGLRLSESKEDSISLKIHPLIAILESDKDLPSLQAAKRAIDSVSASSLTTEYRHVTIRYFARGASPVNPFGERIVVNQRTRKAFWMTSELDDLARQGVIQCYSHPGENYRDWARNENLELFEHPPSKEELLS